MGGDGTGPGGGQRRAESFKGPGPIVENLILNGSPTTWGGNATKKTGDILPDSALAELRKVDAIYLGAIGHPDVKPGILEKGLLLRLRFELDQYINLRPVKLYPNVADCPLKDKGPEHIDFVVVRENTEGLYTGAGGV
jgi:3-isopropylmalate dehydrogenase